MNKKANPIYGIRAKLLSAVSMLLVAVIMVISSTYAWFTLSTAPEVKGISTAIGANGALEMALLESNDPNSVRDGQVPEDENERNYYWGNLVNVSDNTKYGSNLITLLPSTLNTTNEGKNVNTTSFLSTPVYGNDGRVNEVKANTVTGTYDDTSFLQNEEEYGFRAVGTVSGMTERELAYRNYKATANSYMGTATNRAVSSLEDNGGALAKIIIKKADAGDSATFDQTDVASLMAIVNSLLGTDADKVDGVLEYIEQAYVNYIVSYAAATDVSENGTIWTAVKTAADGGTSLSAIITTAGAAVPSEISTFAAALEATKANVEAAKTGLASLSGDSIAWSNLSTPLSKLADVSAMEVNGMTYTEISASPDDFLQKVIDDGMLVKVTMASNAGVYADVADHCGDYSASITVDAEYNGMSLKGITAKMSTASSVKPSYLSVINDIVNADTLYQTGTTVTTNKPISEFYGYILDLAFRTNAADSNLLLQTAPKDRIYADNLENNESTWGLGSTMSFNTSADSHFSADNMRSLMGHISVIFFDTTTGEIFAKAKLDATNAQPTTTGVEAALYLIDEANSNALITEQANAVIKSLDQNVETHVSVLVYLDGETITNADVAAEAAASMTGTLNLQFSSSANLVPMEYGDLHVKGNSTTAAESTTATPESGN